MVGAGGMQCAGRCGAAAGQGEGALLPCRHTCRRLSGGPAQLPCSTNQPCHRQHPAPCTAPPADLLEGAAGGSEDEEGGPSGSEASEEEGGSSEEEEEEGGGLAAASLEELDYDALLAAGAAQRRKRAAAGEASESEDEEEAVAAAGAGAKRPKLSARAAAERAKVEDEFFKLGEQVVCFHLLDCEPAKRLAAAG